MTRSFSILPTETGATISLNDISFFKKRTVPFDAWDPPEETARAAVRYLKRLVDNGDASLVPQGVAVTADGIVSLPMTIANALAVPVIAAVTLTLTVEGRVESPEGLIRFVWQDRNMRRITPNIVGPFLIANGETGRLSQPVYNLLNAIRGYNETLGRSADERIGPWLDVQNALERVTGESVKPDRTLQSLRIYQAGAFALDVREAAGGPKITPVLMAHSMRQSQADEIDAPEVIDGEQLGPVLSDQLPDNDTDALLVPELQKAFVAEFNQRTGRTGPAFALGRNSFVVIEPELQRALDVVKAAQRAPAEERRSFIANPRSFLDRELGDLSDEAGSIFVETHQYSARVLGLGRWEKPTLDWLTKQSTSWLPEKFQLAIGDHKFDLTPSDVDHLKSAVEQATHDFADTLVYQDKALGTLETIDALESLRGFADEGQPFPDGADGQPQTDDGESNAPVDTDILLINDHIDSVGFTAQIVPRRASLFENFPIDLLRSNKPKPHQEEGFAWLVKSWLSGTPGVLLADDMGLGKTFQALSFLAWFRRNQQAAGGRGRLFEGPIIIVAPTALLRNWEAEAGLHLVDDCLGQCVKAFGSNLGRLRTKKNEAWSPEDALDVDTLRDADWILTTYETLATYHRCFARVPYSIGVFDEMQKVKAPDTLNTHALKTLNVDFVLGMTGTPIENRLEDLWCIMDRVGPGYLGGLRDFSRTYNTDNAALKELKAKLDQPTAKHPPVMLRRMKQDILEGLPTKTSTTYPVAMPAEQAAAYANAVSAARRGERTMGAMLKAIHAFRGISLHPSGDRGVDVYDPVSRKAWIAKSARVSKTIDILSAVQMRGEKALVFIEDRAIQSAFTAIIAAELGLDREPDIINGDVAGAKRQDVVDRFQALPKGFDLLILSPKAAGIGLTITAANHVIHLSRWWNPAVEDQCNDRVYRIGQTKPVTVHVPIAVHPALGDSSFDVKLDALLDRKRNLSRDMLAPPITDGDVGELFNGAVE
ncbi:DEAD/DEAH box helicase [Phyllobacterium bourgognense]|uniref:SNF2 family DNA or RNA helicase n=1 Tax=Phyllobacterium bourgognense TaxID=314236 RepID=A0A368Z6J4_9HYPH|nr:DEAD/DEAH box helicase [Phyllobacterium bourgognense]RCW87569.1 SNF2 family DNA or RNA helicase [Phyllobacterium bourgognense]